jgi:Tfp pilus assembly PilM family ATPase
MAAIPNKAVDEEKHELAKQEIGALLPPDSDSSAWCIEKRNIGDLHANSLVLLAAIQRGNVLSVGTEVQTRGPNPVCVDMGLLNAINVFHDYLISSENLEKNIGILNFGHTASSVAIFKQGKLTTVHTRTIGADASMLVGGKNFTDKIKEHFKLSEDEAEEYKKNEVFFLPEFVPEQDKIANYQVIKPVFGELVRGVFTITEHYVARFREFKVDEVIITGGGANFSNIDIVLGGHLNTQVKQGADIVSIVDAENNELSADEKNILTPAIGAFCRE